VGLTARTCRHDHASPDLLGVGGIQFDMMDAPIRAVDNQTDALTHLVASQPLIEHAPDDAFADLLAVQDLGARPDKHRDGHLLQSSRLTRPLRG
jgi:hypothetical protein